MTNTRAVASLSLAAIALSLGAGCGEATEPEDVGETELAISSKAPKPAQVNKILCGVWKGDGDGHNYTLLPNGARTYPFGEDSIARVQFRKDGYATHFVARNPASRPPCANPAGHLACTADEAADAFYSSVAVNYRYVAKPTSRSAGSMTWNVDFSTYPNWEGQSLPRSYELKDRDHLEIVVPIGPGVNAHLELVRVAECNANHDD